MRSKTCCKPDCQEPVYNGGYCQPHYREYHRDYYLKNRDKLIAQQEARRRADPQGHRAKKRQGTRNIRRLVIDAYGGRCKCCGEDRIEFLAIDHVNGNGRQHRLKVSGKGNRFYRWLKKNGFPKDEFRVLCHNCNQSFGLYGYCPHSSPTSFPPTTVQDDYDEYFPL